MNWLKKLFTFYWLRRWLAKREAIKHVNHNIKCGDWHGVYHKDDVIYCGTCQHIFWDGLSKTVRDVAMMPVNRLALRKEEARARARREQARRIQAEITRINSM